MVCDYKLYLAVDVPTFTKEIPKNDRTLFSRPDLDLNSPDRRISFEGPLMVSSSSRKIQFVQAKLMDGYFVLSHRRWQKGGENNTKRPMINIVKDKVSSD